MEGSPSSISRKMSYSSDASASQQDFSFLYDDDVSNDSLFDGLEDDTNNLEDGNESPDSPLSIPFFEVGDDIAVAKFNKYRQNYRQFRKGKAKGAKGEVTKFTKEKKGKGGRNSSVVPPFLEKLYNMLSEDGLEDYIAWGKDGTSIIVKRVAEFSKHILPRYFKHDKFSSFLRQLNMYNFYTIHQEPNMRQFSNPLFRREAKDDMKNIKRKRGTSKKALVVPGTDNNKSNNNNNNNNNSIKSNGKNAKRQKVVNKKNVKLKSEETKIVTTTTQMQLNESKTKTKVNRRPSDRKTASSVNFSNSNLINFKKSGNMNGNWNSNNAELFELQRTLVSMAKANKTMSVEIGVLRKEISSNRSQIKNQHNTIKSLEGNLKSITATYSTMQQTLNMLQQEVRSSRNRGRGMSGMSGISGMSDEFEVPDD